MWQQHPLQISEMLYKDVYQPFVFRTKAVRNERFISFMAFTPIIFDHNIEAKTCWSLTGSLELRSYRRQLQFAGLGLALANRASLLAAVNSILTDKQPRRLIVTDSFIKGSSPPILGASETHLGADQYRRASVDQRLTTSS